MSCPYFCPAEPRAGDRDPHSEMLPLGDLWTGVCRAIPGQDWPPDESVIRRLCHLGYARDACTRFPAGDTGPDAVRFTISRDDGAALRLYYVLERDHHPFTQGPLEYSVGASAFSEPPRDEIVRRQAEAYVASYLRRKEAARAV